VSDDCRLENGCQCLSLLPLHCLGPNVPKGNVAPAGVAYPSRRVRPALETGGVFHGPTIVACDIAPESAKTQAGHTGWLFRCHLWITLIGLSIDCVVMDGGTIAGATENSVVLILVSSIKDHVEQSGRI